MRFSVGGDEMSEGEDTLLTKQRERGRWKEGKRKRGREETSIWKIEMSLEKTSLRFRRCRRLETRYLIDLSEGKFFASPIRQGTKASTRDGRRRMRYFASEL